MIQWRLQGPKKWFAERDKHYPSRSGQTSLATAGANFTKPRTSHFFGLCISLQFQNHVVADNPAAAAAVAANPSSSSDAVPNSLLPLDASSGSTSSSSAAAAAKPANIKNHVGNSLDFSNEELELTDVCRAALLGGSSPGNYTLNQLGII